MKAAQDSAALQHAADEKRVHNTERAYREVEKKREDAETSKAKALKTMQACHLRTLQRLPARASPDATAGSAGS